MESLLRWGIENSASANDAGAPHPPPEPRHDLDPAIIDQILGKPDSVLMQEALAVAVDEARDEDERMIALDDFEMLIEQIDNANNVENMQMWRPLHDLLTSPTSSDKIKMQTLWVVGTTLQNNPAAQLAYLSLDPLPALLSFLSAADHSPQTRSKAVYALSGLLKHNAAGVKKMETAGGWIAVRAALEDSDITVRRKLAFLLNSLLIPNAPPSPSRQTSSLPNLHASPPQPQPQSSQPNPVYPNSHASMLSDPSSTSTSDITLDAITRHGILAVLVSALTTPHGPDGENDGDVDFEEKVIRLLSTYTESCHGKLDPSLKLQLGKFLREQSVKVGGEAALCEQWGIEAGEMTSLVKTVSQ